MHCCFALHCGVTVYRFQGVSTQNVFLGCKDLWFDTSKFEKPDIAPWWGSITLTPAQPYDLSRVLPALSGPGNHSPASLKL